MSLTSWESGILKTKGENVMWPTARTRRDGCIKYMICGDLYPEHGHSDLIGYMHVLVVTKDLLFNL